MTQINNIQQYLTIWRIVDKKTSIFTNQTTILEHQANKQELKTTNNNNYIEHGIRPIETDVV